VARPVLWALVGLASSCSEVPLCPASLATPSKQPGRLPALRVDQLRAPGPVHMPSTPSRQAPAPGKMPVRGRPVEPFRLASPRRRRPSLARELPLQRVATPPPPVNWHPGPGRYCDQIAGNWRPPRAEAPRAAATRARGCRAPAAPREPPSSAPTHGLARAASLLQGDIPVTRFQGTRHSVREPLDEGGACPNPPLAFCALSKGLLAARAVAAARPAPCPRLSGRWPRAVSNATPEAGTPPPRCFTLPLPRGPGVLLVTSVATACARLLVRPPDCGTLRLKKKKLSPELATSLAITPTVVPVVVG